MMEVKLRELRLSVAASHVEEGSTLQARQAANTKRRSLYAQLDSCRTTLDKLQAEVQASGQDAAEIEAWNLTGTVEVDTTWLSTLPRYVTATVRTVGIWQELALRLTNLSVLGLRQEVEDLVSMLVIRPIQHRFWLLDMIDILWRAPAVFLVVGFMGFVTSVPLILLTMLEHQLFLLQRNRRRRNRVKREGACEAPVDGEKSTPGSSSSASGYASARPTGTGASTAGGRPTSTETGGWNGGLSSMIKRFDACLILLVMGVHVCAEGLRECDLSRPAMLLFSHVSTLDAMIILGTFPRAFCAVVKEELFAVPIVGWIMASHGGVPINRRQRAAAVQALGETAERARDLELFVAMAPEGTRSKTGQLGPFKKGALHMQEQLQWPVIPVTIRGAYELFPLKAYSNQCGKVVVRFHRPILASEVKSRDALAKRLRQEMLEAVIQPAPEAGCPLTILQRMKSFGAVATTYWVAGRALTWLATFARREGVAISALVAGSFAYIALSTIFVYFVYARRCLSGRGRARAVRSGAASRVASAMDPALGAAIDGARLTVGAGAEDAEEKNGKRSRSGGSRRGRGQRGGEGEEEIARLLGGVGDDPEPHPKE